MKEDRQFAPFDPDGESPSVAYRNVTSEAREWGFPFELHVSRNLLSRYATPHLSFDDEGYYLVGELVMELEAALAAEVPIRVVSHGLCFSLKYRFAARHRRNGEIDCLELSARIGPCDGFQVIWVNLA